MKRALGILFAISTLIITGCGSTPSAPIFKTTNQFKIDNIHFKLSQLVTPEIEYHTEEEMKKIIIPQIEDRLQRANLLTNDESANNLFIFLDYQRRFVGDASPFPSDSLSTPFFGYTIEIREGNKVISTISRNRLIYKAGFTFNLKIVSGSLREKSDELTFLNALADKIIDEIKNIRLQSN
ncbi:hypothetical protein KIH87_06680 [Paraneptunicella aestuarii]|uniref:hypothetical protein n=1 Tax=Paraneptunicella aestuarii TaxID=2831148 RepID=UPI001E4632DE|nr:hypothetical protein [Paraneptunicella aestuarii]UAA40029.1 hypothetical protein KIH87_06680 [Paraneptunicella aestuarii]